MLRRKQVTSAPCEPHLVFLRSNTTKRLLEVYVKRTASLKDAATSDRKQRVNLRKWVTLNEYDRRRGSSKRSTVGTLTKKKDKCSEERQGNFTTISTKTKRSSVSRFFCRFSWTRSKKKDEGDCASNIASACASSGQNDPSQAEFGVDEELRAESEVVASSRPSKPVSTNASSRSLSFMSRFRERSSKKSLSAPKDLVCLPDVDTVEPNDAYLEKVSEKLEQIVKEVTERPRKEPVAPFPEPVDVKDFAHAKGDENIIERIISLLKQEGDIINEEIKNNRLLDTFVKKLTFASFQQLADRYLAQIPQNSPAPPELVKLAFTLDFTAKVAGLSGQTVGRVMGFGNRYLRDHFSQLCAITKQVSEDPEGVISFETD